MLYVLHICFFEVIFFKQKTAYGMRISDWSSDVCSSDLFSWAALVGWSEVAGALTLPGLLLYAGAIAWVIGYDTIYALQDREDDALIGVRSSALRMGRHVRSGTAGFYILALALWAAAIWQVRADPLALDRKSTRLNSSH